MGSAACGAIGKIGPAPSSGTRSAAPTIAATATGMKLRGFHSKSSSSTASSDRGDRRGEDRRHARRRAGDEQRLAFGGGQVERLREERTERAARHDDRAFRAERAAGADRDGGGERLEHRDLEARCGCGR